MTAGNDAAWHEWRAKGIGGSDIAGILGLSRYSSPWSVWADKVGLLAPEPSSPRQLVGKALEPAIGELFHQRHPHLWLAGEQTWCEHPEHSWARCTVDGFVVESEPSDISAAIGVHEMKTDGRASWPEGIPEAIRAQCVWQMGVTGHRHCWLSVLHSGFRFDVYELPWDHSAEADWDLMLTRAALLWEEHIETGIPPEPDGHEATAAALAAVYPDHEVGTRASLDDLAEEVAELWEVRAASRALEAREAELRNLLLESVGSAELGTVAGEVVLSARWGTRTTVDSKAVRAEHGNRYDQTTRARKLAQPAARDRKGAA